jgi:hypothetical protein
MSGQTTKFAFLSIASCCDAVQMQILIAAATIDEEKIE